VCFNAGFDLVKVGFDLTKPKFKYDMLEKPGNIRLLLLHCRDPIDAIECTLFQVSLKAVPYYEAISYTWGESQERHNILVNGRRLEIPHSAFRVLDSRSSFWTPRLLWIDSIRINQSDNDSSDSDDRDNNEKTCQIQLMKEIYQKAYAVSGCLLPPENVDNPAAEYIEAHLASDIVDELLYTDLNPYRTDFSIWKTYASQIRQPRWLAFQNLLRNGWFDRVWVGRKLP
jgi:hypothetical protein